MRSFFVNLLTVFGIGVRNQNSEPTKAPVDRPAATETRLVRANSSPQVAPPAVSPVTIAAFHEAGHCVLAYLSQFHGIAPGTISLGSYGSGAADVMLRKSALREAGLPEDERSTAHPHVASDLAVILVAGLAAERIAATRYSWLHPDVQCAAPDYQKAQADLARAGVSTSLDVPESLATQVLQNHWDVVERIANALQQKNTMEGHEVLDILMDHVGS